MKPDDLKIYLLHMRKDSDIGNRAISDSDAIRYREEDQESEFDIRPSFFRDVDRIVHSLCYSRYIDRSQVFFGINNANITHRSLHVILVSRVSRQIGRILKLNNDLIEAISLGHDLGHPPAGHLGEEILNEISKEYNIGSYTHNAQGVRWLTYLEKRFPNEPANGLNLTLQVLDGILCHDGEVHEQKLKPKKVNGKSWEDHFKEYNDAFGENKIRRIPMSYEGVAVRLADTISYIGRDIEDAILLKFIDRSEIPSSCTEILGDTNRKIMKTLIMDLLKNSIANDYIGYSEEIFEALKELKKFNYDRIYTRRNLFSKTKTKDTFEYELRKKFYLIFQKSLADLENANYNAPIFKEHIDYIDDKNYTTYYEPYKNEGKLPIIARDYMAGMSDKYFYQIYGICKDLE